MFKIASLAAAAALASTLCVVLAAPSFAQSATHGESQHQTRGPSGSTSGGGFEQSVQCYPGAIAYRPVCSRPKLPKLTEGGQCYCQDIRYTKANGKIGIRTECGDIRPKAVSYRILPADHCEDLRRKPVR